MIGKLDLKLAFERQHDVYTCVGGHAGLEQIRGELERLDIGIEPAVLLQDAADSLDVYVGVQLVTSLNFLRWRSNGDFRGDSVREFQGLREDDRRSVVAVVSQTEGRNG